jgi:phosphatidylglycerol:prolipoprotein diacylglycerol transferase
MRPDLFHIGSGPHAVAVHSYGFLIAIGLVVGVALAVRRGRSIGMQTAPILDLTFYALVFGLVGARLLYVLMHAGEYARLCAGAGTARTLGQKLSDCTAALHIWQGGLVFLGGGIFAAAAVLFIARRARLGLGDVADVLAPSVSAAHIFGRIGCFLVGCCYGKFWPSGVRFPSGSVAYSELAASHALPPDTALTLPLHPTQLYEAFGELLVFLLLAWLWRRRKFPGAVALAYAMAYGLVRFVVEIFRGDTVRGFVFQFPASDPILLSTAQATSLALILIGAVGYMTLSRRRASSPSS